MAFQDYVEVVGTDAWRGMRMSMAEAETVLRGFRAGQHVTPRLVWARR